MKRNTCGTIMLLCAGILLFVAFRVTHQVGPESAQKAVEWDLSLKEAQQPVGSGVPGTSSSDSLPPQQWAPVGNILDDVTPPLSTHEEMLAKGFPVITFIRKELLFRIANLSVPETVRDLGNVNSLAVAMSLSNGSGGFPQLSFWSEALPRQLGVLRLIEAGRKNPDAVYPLLEEQILKELEGYEGLHREYLEERRNMVLIPASQPGLSSDDEYYAIHRQYEYPIYEMRRRHLSANSAFYVMANIDGIRNVDLLARWFEEAESQFHVSPDMNLWFIGEYARSPAGVTFASIFRDLASGHAIPESEGVRSRWNANVDIEDSLLAARNVNVSDIPTIKIKEIPRTIDMPADVKERIFIAFMKHASERQ